jgi:hypothetical protein
MLKVGDEVFVEDLSMEGRFGFYTVVVKKFLDNKKLAVCQWKKHPIEEEYEVSSLILRTPGNLKKLLHATAILEKLERG